MLIKLRYIIGYFIAHKNGRLLLLASISSVGLFLILTTIYLYKVEKFKSIENDERLISSYFIYGDDIGLYERKLSQIDTLSHGLKEKLNSGHSKSDIVKDMAKLAAESSISLESQVFDSQQDKKERIYLSLNIVGNYKNIRLFINGLYGLPFWAEIISANLEKNNSKQATLRCQLRVAIH